MGEFPSGQRGQAVNLLSLTSVVRIHLPPPHPRTCIAVVILMGKQILSDSAGWIPAPRIPYGLIAQPVEQGTENPRVAGSTPAQSTIIFLKEEILL